MVEDAVPGDLQAGVEAEDAAGRRGRVHAEPPGKGFTGRALARPEGATGNSQGWSGPMARATPGPATHILGSPAGATALAGSCAPLGLRIGLARSATGC